VKKFEHGGDIRHLAQMTGRPERELLDFSANINPLGPPEWLRPLISSRLSMLQHYPDPHCTALVEATAECYGVDREEVIAGNGSTEILYLVARAAGKSHALIPVPSYGDYGKAATQAGMRIQTLPCGDPLPEDSLTADTVVFLGQPNNPTGTLFPAETLRTLAANHASTLFVVDEAFGDFVEDFDSLTRRRPANVVVLLSLTKIFAIPGLRSGCAVGNPELIRRLLELQPPWSVNALAQAVSTAALGDREYVRRTREYVTRVRERLFAGLSALPGVTVYPGQANFLLAKVDRAGMDAVALAERMLSHGIAIRTCTTFQGLDARYFRVAVRTADENDRLLRTLRAILGGSQPRPSKKAAKTIMFQGTSSNAGKSVLTAALCRILQQDGVRVAPYKSQNMSLNSFVTRDGKEMGRAQVVQAQACRLEPDARMNPILLKPNSDTGAQVIVLGKPVGNMNVTEYIDYKPQAFAVAKQALDELRAENEVVVLEGAGSPAEINLKRHDIVNMAMAQYANAPVLLVGDIDRGGVFASFIGTMEVMEEWERALIAGFVVNRFRGQESLLTEALEYTQRHTNRPVFGVVPFLRDLGLPEEDSVSFKAAKPDNSNVASECVDIAVVDLPHISNFTDFDALRIEPDVRVRIVRQPAELGHPDAVILPGSKNVIADLAYLRQTCLATAIAGLAREGKTEVVGICGGYQILGERIADPTGVESHTGSVQGLGCLSLATEMGAEKSLKRIAGRHCESGCRVQGYEIHHGQSVIAGQLRPIFIAEDGSTLGVSAAELPVWGTYLHGVFDADEFRRWFIDRLRARRHWPAVGTVVAVYDLQEAFDRLAGVVRQSLKMDEIYRLLGRA
jgi:cobyric acid synthase CobQ/L-threonine-O-3-phosphate decarboxylase